MFQGKVFMATLLLCSLGACTQNAKKAMLNEGLPQINDVAETIPKVDFEKAARLNLELGLNYLKQEQVSRAKSKFNRAKTLAPHLPEVHYSYGHYLEYVGELGNAEKAYQKAISLNAKNGNAHNNYGAFLCRQHHYRKAEKEFQKALEDPDYSNTSEALENAGLCVLQIPDAAKAAEYFKKALRYDPNRPNALIELAILKYQQKNLPEAKDFHTRFVQVSKPTSRSLLLGLELAKAMGDQNKEASYRLLLNAQFPDAKVSELNHS